MILFLKVKYFDINWIFCWRCKIRSYNRVYCHCIAKGIWHIFEQLIDINFDSH